jgi:Na+-transporting methylmalonyl-CoA/oxaloacetate decarboxylase gamma subunit
METAETLMALGDFFVFLGLVILAFLFVVLVVSRLIQRRLDQHLEEIAEELATEQLIPLTVEQHEDQFLCYNSITKAFVCQGTDLEDIIKRFKARYPDKSASVYNGDPLAVKTLRQQFEKLKNENSDSIRHSS